MTAAIQTFLMKNNVTLRHAINLQDFRAYCGAHAVLSRKPLAETGKMTEFYSDETDKERGVWNRVFGNFSDNGRLFWEHDGCPNLYGPIAIAFKPNVWSLTEDIAICQRNAASDGFDLDKERFNMMQVQDCFDEYGKLRRNGLEVSLGVESIPFDMVERIDVEPIVRLMDAVETSVRDSEIGKVVSPRDTTPQEGSRTTIAQKQKDQEAKFDRAIEWSREFKGSPPAADKLRPPQHLEEWFKRLTSKPAIRQWLEYTYNGTLSQLEET